MDFDQEVIPGSFEHAFCHLLDHELDLAEFHAQYTRKEMGASKAPLYHWHIEIIPKLTYVAGFEWGTGFYINPVAPEESAKALREDGSN